MNNIIIERLSDKNFNPCSMDDFLRYEEVTQVWKAVDGEYILTDSEYIMDWDLEKRRETARTILEGIHHGGFAYGAFDGGKLAGYIYVTGERFGSSHQYTELALFHISAPYRRMGIGKQLFRLACDEARAIGAQKLYISSGPTKNTQAAYRRFGCVHAEEIKASAVERYPNDIQLEFHLTD